MRDPDNRVATVACRSATGERALSLHGNGVVEPPPILLTAAVFV
jgi:hypothetical protein